MGDEVIQYAMPRKVVLGTAVGGVQTAITDSSKLEALWSELFKEKERNLMRRRLEHGEVAFALEALTLSVHIRFIRVLPPVEDTHLFMAEPVALVLHDLEGRLTDSWALSKLVLPLFEKGFSVVLVDLPGCGRSAVCGNAWADKNAWLSKGWKVVAKVMDRLKIGKAHLVATGEGCHIAMAAMQELPSRIERFHVFHNPVIHLDGLFEVKKPPGCTPERLFELQGKQIAALTGLLQKLDLRIWATFDAGAPPKCDEVLDIVQDVWDRMGCGSYFTVTHLEEQQASVARVGSVVTACALFPCRWLKKAWVKFLMYGLPHGSQDRELSSRQDRKQAAHTTSVQLPKKQPQDANQRPLPEVPSRVGDGQSGLAQWATSDQLSTAVLGHMQRQSSELAMRRLESKGSRAGRDGMQRQISDPTSTSSYDGTVSITSSRCQSHVSLPRTQACRMDVAIVAAAERALPSVTAERKRVLACTGHASKLRNWSELRAIDEHQRDPNLTDEERGWLQKALDDSMATLEEDSQRRSRSMMGRPTKGSRRALRATDTSDVAQISAQNYRAKGERKRSKHTVPNQEQSDGFDESPRTSMPKSHGQRVGYSDGWGESGALSKQQENIFRKTGGLRFAKPVRFDE